MQLLVLLGFLAVAHSQVTDQRQKSMNVVVLLNNTIPSYQNATDLAILRISEAKRQVSDALNDFYASVLNAKAASLQSMFKIEQDFLQYGTKFDPFCWENNVPMLEGWMGWMGTQYSYCIKVLDNSIAKIVATIYGKFQEGETTIRKYSLFEVFEMKNIINNPQSIIDAIGNLTTNVIDAVPDFGGVVTKFTDDLRAKLPSYTCCLTDQLAEPIAEIERMKILAENCTSNLRVYGDE